VSWLERCCHYIDRIARRCKEENLEDRVVGAIRERPEYIDVSGDVDYKIQRL
jgi:hypothetical protein